MFFLQNYVSDFRFLLYYPDKVNLKMHLSGAEKMLIEILNWSRYNPRRDGSFSAWVRVNNNFLTSMFKFTSDEKMVWLALLFEASNKQTGLISPDLMLISTLIRCDQLTVDAALNKFQDADMIKFAAARKRPADGSATARARTNTYERTNERTERESDKPDLAPNGAPPPFDLVEIWNRARGTLPAARLTPSRRAKVASRLKEEPEADYWTTTIRRLAGSTFATGTNDRGWRADFGWLIANSENHVKVNEGKYDNRTISLAPAPKQKHRNQPTIFEAIIKPEGDESA